MMEGIINLGLGLADLFYPRLCEGCNKPLLPEEEVLCLNCNVYYLPRTAYHHIADNETAMRFTGRTKFERATSLAYFTPDGLLQHLMHGLKYEGKREIGRFLGRQLGYDLQQVNWANDIDVVVPIPLHKQKEAERGYNQTAIIGEGLCEVLKLPLENLIARTRYTESQTQKSREERIENMKDAFRFCVGLRDGVHILLLDDVLTTGATLEAAASALLLYSAEIKLSIATIGIVT